jgi:hypothetical protein
MCHILRDIPRPRHLGLLLQVGMLCLALATTALAAGAAQPAAQRDFASAEEAAAALIGAMQANDEPALLSIYGPEAEHLVASGDVAADHNARKRFVDLYEKHHALEAKGEGRMVLVVGPDAWQMPIPLVQAAGRWRFDAVHGMQEIIDRRIGRNELDTIRTVFSVVAAQNDYFERMRAEFGGGAYAQRLVSSAGKHDGLTWDTAAGEPRSPLGALVEQDAAGANPDAQTVPTGQPVPYHGYYFRMLTAQGPNAHGGAMNYVRNGLMTEGFALVAWPAHYQASGIMTFLVNQEGVVFQKDLGEHTDRVVARMTRFDPDINWLRVRVQE